MSKRTSSSLLVIAFGLLLSPCLTRAQNWKAEANTGLTAAIRSFFIASNGEFFAGTVGAVNGSDGVIVSTDSAGTWTAAPNPGILLGPVYGINSKDEIFAGSGQYVEWSSTDYGNSWQEIRIDTSSPFDPQINNFAIAANGYMFVATGGSELWTTSDYGADWDTEEVFKDSTIYPTFVASSLSGDIFSGNDTLLAHAASGTGTTWDSIGSAPPLGEHVAFAFGPSQTIVAGGTGGVFLSTNNGSVWESITPPPPASDNAQRFYTLAIDSNGNIYVGTHTVDSKTGGVVLSTDNGQHWADITSGLTTDSVYAFAFKPHGALYAATNDGVFQYLGPTSGVSSSGNGIPSSLALAQNTPNPASSVTNFHFTLPESGNVSLRVFDVMGREIATAASGYYSEGSYDIFFDTHALLAGCYYYRIESGGETASRMFTIER